ncbi:hypothetical protein [Methanosphaera sp. WGK6]|uniref:hypothetical protein n=1 Tax=Methanosphaera sp. WGK6 TaxID=1561964 RepID=UPI00084BE78D|nr:hypothetical protein [Methanosphaera sp. WGK6]OED30547.1 hypothetical protein NL43_02720 [Methanosphaera sp. WGK6]
MSDKKITYDDVKQYESLFTMVPSFILGTTIKRNTNVVSKFKSIVLSNLESLSPENREKLNIILESEVSELQSVMKIAYSKTKKKQYKLLADPKAVDFIKFNLNELKKLL